MAKMYKPNKITMSPNNETINQDVNNNFSFVFNGETLSRVRLFIRDMTGGPHILPRTYDFSPVLTNGSLVNMDLPPLAGTNGENSPFKWSVAMYGFPYPSSTDGGFWSETITIPGATFQIVDQVEIPSSIYGQPLVYLAKVRANEYRAYATLEGARSGGGLSGFLTRLVTGENFVTRAVLNSEEVVCYATSLPTFTLGAQNATSAILTVNPTYSHPYGYMMRNYIVEIYNDIGDLVYRSVDIYSSNVSYTFNNLIDGENWFIRFYGYNTVEQYVDTGIIPVSVNYAPNITPLDLEINGSNNCQHGRVDLLLEAVGSTIILENGVYIDVTDVIIKRQEVGQTTWETVAFLPFGVPEYHDYLASSGKSYIYRMYIYGVCRIVVNELDNPNTPFVDGAFYMIPNNMISPVVLVEYFGWFLVDLDGDKSYKIDVEFDGGEMKQEDDFTTYKTNVSYNTYSVGNTRHFVSSATGLISVDNLYNDFDNTNDVLEEIKNLISPSNRNRKLIKDRRRPTRIYPVFTYGYTETPLNNAIGKQPYLCSFSWDQVDYEIK